MSMPSSFGRDAKACGVVFRSVRPQNQSKLAQYWSHLGIYCRDLPRRFQFQVHSLCHRSPVQWLHLAGIWRYRGFDELQGVRQ